MKKQKQQIKVWLWFFIIALFLSGATAIPADTGLSFILKNISADSSAAHFLAHKQNGVSKTQAQYPFLFYGYDWLAFANVILAVLFIGPLRNPVRNKWLIEFGMMACLLIIPFAMITGYFRGIPVWWRLIDCSFGIIGMIPLFIYYEKINSLELADSPKSTVYKN
jgi:hypothetical protein